MNNTKKGIKSALRMTKYKVTYENMFWSNVLDTLRVLSISKKMFWHKIKFFCCCFLGGKYQSVILYRSSPAVPHPCPGPKKDLMICLVKYSLGLSTLLQSLNIYNIYSFTIVNNTFRLKEDANKNKLIKYSLYSPLLRHWV